MVRFMLPFYGVLSLAYLALGAAWVVASAAKWRTLMPLQYCVALVVALGMAESSAWYFDYVNFNATGYRPYAATVFAVLLGSARKALSRSLVLVVAMGYGVARPTLGGLTRDVVGLSLAYFVAASALDLEANLGKVDDLTSTARLVLVAPVAFLDATYILWIFTALRGRWRRRRRGDRRLNSNSIDDSPTPSRCAWWRPWVGSSTRCGSR